MKIEIYGATWCQSCQVAKKICDTNKLEYNYMDIDDSKVFGELTARLGHMAKSVPQIFIDGERYTGTVSELQGLLKPV